MVNYIFVIVFVMFCTFGIFCQDCRRPGESCSDTKSCCGGCCRDFMCIDTFDDCTVNFDPCYSAYGIYCPPHTECTIFQPNCDGCSPQKLCKSVTPIPTYLPPTSEQPDIFSKGTKLKHVTGLGIVFNIIVCIMYL